MKLPMTIDGLSLRGVGVSFGSVVALNALDLQLPATGIVAFVGHNGSGKSTLLDVLSGFIRQTRGCILGPSARGTLTRRELIASVARLHQRLVIPSDLPADDFLALVRQKLSAFSLLRSWNAAGYRTRSISDSSIELLHVVGLAESMHRPLGKLSYGQQRAVALEAVLATGKPFVTLDEPLAGLHPSVRSAALTRIKREGRTRCVLVAEHDLPGALELADRVVVLRRGDIVADLPARGLTTKDVLSRL